MFGLSFLTPKAILIGLVVLAFLSLAGRERYVTYQLKLSRAETIAAQAQRDEAIAANAGLAGQVESLTADKAAADLKAAGDRRALESMQSAAGTGLAATTREIDRAATPADDVELPSLRVWFDRLRQGSANPDHPTAASDREATSGPRARDAVPLRRLGAGVDRAGHRAQRRARRGGDRGRARLQCLEARAHRRRG